MSAIVDTLTTSSTDRTMVATRNLCDALGLGTLKPKDLKHLSVALAEATTDEVRHNTVFREQVLTLYNELAVSSQPPTASKKKVAEKPIKPHLTPIRQVDPKLFGPDRPLDPYLVHYAYGDDQLRLVLERFPVSELKKATTLVEQRNPGTKPTNRAQKTALLDYIVAHIV